MLKYLHIFIVRKNRLHRFAKLNGSDWCIMFQCVHHWSPYFCFTFNLLYITFYTVLEIHQM